MLFVQVNLFFSAFGVNLLVRLLQSLRTSWEDTEKEKVG